MDAFFTLFKNFSTVLFSSDFFIIIFVMLVVSFLVLKLTRR